MNSNTYLDPVPDIKVMFRWTISRWQMRANFSDMIQMNNDNDTDQYKVHPCLSVTGLLGSEKIAHKGP